MAGPLAYFKLVRLPNVFSALADIIAGFFIAKYLVAAHLGFFTGFDDIARKLPFALCASICLYLAGMAFNDIADRKADARERPERPIPSGAVSLGGALICAAALLCAGLLSASYLGEFSLKIAGALTFSILAYDFVGKQPAAAKLILPGPLLLGLCRGGNMLLGISAAVKAEDLFRGSLIFDSLWLTVFAGGFFGAAVTAFSAQEESGKKTSALVLGWLCVGASFGCALWAGWNEFQYANGKPLSMDVLWRLFGVFWLARVFMALVSKSKTVWREGSPASARALVLAGLKSFCFVDTALVLLILGGNKFPGVGNLAFPVACAIFLLQYPGAWLRKALTQYEA